MTDLTFPLVPRSLPPDPTPATKREREVTGHYTGSYTVSGGMSYPFVPDGTTFKDRCVVCGAHSPTRFVCCK